jgi:two-component system chemotaxis response regulator CheY
MKVLVVDDSPIERMFMSVFLEEIAEVDFASNGAEAIAFVQRTIDSNMPYDLICLDNIMPVMDGLQALNSIRALESGNGMRRSKVFMITSSSSPDDMVEAITGGECDDYLVKPIVADTLCKLLVKHGLLEGTHEE